MVFCLMNDIHYLMYMLNGSRKSIIETEIYATQVKAVKGMIGKVHKASRQSQCKFKLQMEH